MFNSNILSVPGKSRFFEKTLCEDIIVTSETDELHYFGLADGQSGKKYCTEGAKEALLAVNDFFAKKGIGFLKENRYYDEIQYQLILLIRERLESKARKYNADITEFGSTLISLGVDPASGDYVLAHLGDGRVIGIGKKGELKNISSPENGLCPNQTWLTTSPYAANHIRIYMGNIENYRRIILMSDGADGLFRKKVYSSGFFAAGDITAIFGYVAENPAADDSSLLILDNLAPLPASEN